jgi:hypothetical protein
MAAFAAALAMATLAPAPVTAGSLGEKARVELQALGVHSGYIAATIAPCGGDEDEVAYFTEQVKKMLVRVGGDEADFAIVLEAMADGRADAKPQGRDCTDEGGLELASELGRLRDAVRDAGK